MKVPPSSWRRSWGAAWSLTRGRRHGMLWRAFPGRRVGGSLPEGPRRTRRLVDIGGAGAAPRRRRLVPDIPGWRREHMPQMPETAWFETRRTGSARSSPPPPPATTGWSRCPSTRALGLATSGCLTQICALSRSTPWSRDVGSSWRATATMPGSPRRRSAPLRSTWGSGPDLPAAILVGPSGRCPGRKVGRHGPTPGIGAAVASARLLSPRREDPSVRHHASRGYPNRTGPAGAKMRLTGNFVARRKKDNVPRPSPDPTALTVPTAQETCVRQGTRIRSPCTG